MKIDYKQLSSVTLIFILISLIATTSAVIFALLSYFIGNLLIN